MDKMRMESADITDQNIEKIGALFPNCITETKDENGKLTKAINFELLKQELSKEIIGGDEAYEFTWVGKKAAIVEANKPIRKTLRPCKAESVDWDTTENLYIEGDNLEVLKLLQESYLGKVKMIYIDPPYNTGNDFIYDDSFKQSQNEYEEDSGAIDENGDRMFKNTDSNGRFHSDWCSMIYSRLALARNLLSEDGIIFISIDENELDNLIKMGNEVFGEENAIPIFNRVTKKSSNSGNNFSPCMDYVVSYAKNLNYLCEFSVPLTEEIRSRYKLSDDYVNERGPYQEVGLFQAALKHGGSSYPIECPDGERVVPPNGQPWRWNKDTFEKGLSEGRIVFKKSDRTGLLDYETKKSAHWNIYTKVYLTEREGKGIHPKNFSDDFQNTLASNELNKLGIPFDFAKPTKLLVFLAGLLDDTDGIYLDFFSGSATTADALMQLNAKDRGSRKFIMVQLPEKCEPGAVADEASYKNICEIGKERIRRAAKKIHEEHPDAKFDDGFRVLKIDDSNMTDVYYSADSYNQNMLNQLESNIKPDRTDLDLLFGCLLEWGLPLSMPYTSEDIEGCKVHTYNDGDLIACFDENIPDSVIKEVAKRKPLRAVFRDSSFRGSPEKINVGETFKLLSPDTRVKII